MTMAKTAKTPKPPEEPDTFEEPPEDVEPDFEAELVEEEEDSS